jgi:polar amino acid transport system substrate-binding protein
VLGECQDRRGKLWRIAAVFAATSALVLSGCASGTDTGEPANGTPAAAAEKVDEIANTVP